MTADSENPSDAQSPRSRLTRALTSGWTPIVVLLLAAAGLAWLWFLAWFDEDVRNSVTIGILVAVVLLCVAWFSFWSKYSAKLRRGVGIGFLAAVVIFFSLVRFEEVTGDMHVTLAWRWSPKADEKIALDVAPREQAASIDLTRTTPNEFPQFLGPRRRAEVDGVKLAKWWPEPPKCLWRQPIGAGCSGFAVVGDCAITQEQRGDEELVVCYDLKTGKVHWSHADAGRFESVMGGDGPRATPTIDEGRVYTLGAFGVLNCLDGATGGPIWSKNVLEENGADNLNWGMSGSPLVTDKWVIVNVGGTSGRSLVAYDKQTGEFVWGGGDDVASYASPALGDLCGARQVVIVNQDWVAGHRFTDGKVLWRHPWPGSSSSDATASQAVPLPGDRIFISKGYGVGAALWQVAKDESGNFAVTPIWEKSDVMRTKMTNVAIRDGYVYGLSHGILECIELETGKRMWKKGRYGHGQILLAGDVLVVTGEDGAAALVEASPEAYRELGRFQALDGKTWNTFALAGPYLVVRNHKEAACYELPVDEDRR